MVLAPRIAPRCCAQHNQHHHRLLDIDYRGNTVLVHAAGVGRSATFDAFLEAIQSFFSEEEVSEERGSAD